MTQRFEKRPSVRLVVSALPLSLVVVCAGFLTPVAVSAAGTGGKVAKASITGEVSGKMTAPPLMTASDGLMERGCQISPNTNKMLIVNFASTKLKVGGHVEAASDLQLSVDLIKDGNTESLAPIVHGTNFVNGVSFSLRAKGRDYAWSSISGTVRSTAGARGGAFNAELLPLGSPRLVHGPHTAAKTPVHLSGSWIGCHAGA